MMLHTNHQGCRPCGFRLEDFCMFSLYKSMQTCDPGWAHFWSKGHLLNKVGRGPLDIA